MMTYLRFILFPLLTVLFFSCGNSYKKVDYQKLQKEYEFEKAKIIAEKKNKWRSVKHKLMPKYNKIRSIYDLVSSYSDYTLSENLSFKTIRPEFSTKNVAFNSLLISAKPWWFFEGEKGTGNSIDGLPLAFNDEYFKRSQLALGDTALSSMKLLLESEQNQYLNINYIFIIRTLQLNLPQTNTVEEEQNGYFQGLIFVYDLKTEKELLQFEVIARNSKNINNSDDVNSSSINLKKDLHTNIIREINTSIAKYFDYKENLNKNQ